jgi:hypothetical protein
MISDKICADVECGKVFAPSSGRQLYCIDCKLIMKYKYDLSFSRKINKRYLTSKKCLVCGTDFLTYYRNQTVCNNSICKHNIFKIRNHDNYIKTNCVLKLKTYFKNIDYITL